LIGSSEIVFCPGTGRMPGAYFCRVHRFMRGAFRVVR
jgi:hypothetical protein